jgi:hypothetical protein
MKLRIEHRVSLAPFSDRFGKGPGWVKAVLPLRDDAAVAHVSTYREEADFDTFDTHLLLIEGGEARPLDTPRSVNEKRRELEADPAMEEAIGGDGTVSFLFGPKLGLLLADRHLWLLDPSGGDAPIEIEIPPLAPFRNDWGDHAYCVHRAGVPTDRTVPVIFRHPHSPTDFSSYLAFLEIDEEQRKAQWIRRGKDGQPFPVRYSADPGFEHCSEAEGYQQETGTNIGDVIQLGDRLRIFSLGDQGNFRRFNRRMTAVTVIETDLHGSDARLLHSVDESTFGAFSGDGSQVLLTPLFQRGPRKGKPGLLDLRTLEEAPLAVRGLAKYEPYTFTSSGVWWVGGGDTTGEWRGATLYGGEGHTAEIVWTRWE